MGILSKIFGGIKKIIKGVGKIIKRGAKKVGSFFKRVFVGIGKFVGKLGPLGMLGMMLIMPHLGAWWSQFGAWAGNLTGPMAGFMKAVHATGNFIGKAYSSVTEGIDKVLGGFAETVGLGDAYTGAKGWLGDKVESLQGKLGLHTSESAALFKEGLFKEGLQEVAITAVKRPVSTYVKPSAITYKGPTVPPAAVSSIPGGVPPAVPTAEEAFKAGLQEVDVSAITSQYKIDPLTGKPVGYRSTAQKAWDKIQAVSTGVSSIKQLAADLGLTEEEYLQQFGGGAADLALDIETSIAGSNADWTTQGYQGQAAYGPGSQQWQQSILQWMQQQDPTYLQWMRSGAQTFGNIKF